MKSKRMMAGALAVLTVFSGVCLPNSSVFSANALAEKYEAEDAALSEVTIMNDEDYSGGKYVKFESTGSCTFTVEISETGLYDLNLYSYGCGGDKINLCYVDGENMGEFTSGNGTYGKSVVSNVGLTAGTHEISIQSSWGWIYFDYMEITESEGVSDAVYNVSKELVNQKATESTQRLYSYLCDVYGEKIITGQQCDDGLNGSEFNAVKSVTGKTPAILGLDLMNYSPSRVELGASSDAVEKAIEFSDAGGIVTFCWHWNAPSDYLKSGTNNGNPRWWGGFYTENVDTDSMKLEEMLSGNDKYGYYFLCDEVDAIAEQLKKLQDADVPVLFRPLHEASGGWFWWGAYGAETYKKLWNFVYDRLTNKHGLNNLIWVWNGQDPDWYPGDETVDIIGEDIYPGNQVYNPQSSKFAELTQYTKSNKLIAMTENGCLFNIDQAFSNNTKWSWFCTWSGDFSASSEEYTENDMWVDVYQNENAVTLESLPDLKTYPMDSEKVSLSDDSIDIKITEQSFDYTGSEIKPELIVEKDGTALVSGEDYSVSYEDNISVGNGKVIVKGIGTYTGTLTLTFIIKETEITDIADCEIILANNSLEYTGYAQKPKVTVKAGEKVLTSGTDYVVRYFDNVEVGTASVKIAGRGDYSGSQIVNFEITESAYTPLSKCDITLSKTKYLYTGSVIKPRVTIKNGSTVLVQNTDYVIRYINNIEAGTASVVIAGRGSYTGSVTKYFTIEPLGTRDFTQCTVTLSKTKYEYSGKANKPKVTVKDGSTTLTANTDYVLRYQNNIEVGTASVIIAGRGDYTGSITKTFEIVGNTKDISDCTITLSSYTEKYTGEPITPQVTVKYNGTNLVESVDYQVSYSDNVEIGTAAVTITGIGDYTGTEIKTFEITEPSTAQIEKVVNLWGNSLIAGNQDGTGVTIATALQDCLGEDWEVNNYGNGGESSNTVASRQGGIQLLVEPFTIPATKTAVDINLTDSTGGIINFRTSIMSASICQSVNPVYINGVKGTISHGSTWGKNPYKFTRLEEGEEVEVTETTPVYTKAQLEITSADSVLVIWIGENGGWDTVDELIDMIQAMIDKNGSKYYLIMSMTKNGIQETNDAMAEAFGNHYIDSRRYLIDNGLEDAGLTATEEDLALIAEDKMPKSLLVESDNTHFNKYGYTVIGKLIYKHGQQLGYWD